MSDNKIPDWDFQGLTSARHPLASTSPGSGTGGATPSEGPVGAVLPQPPVKWYWRWKIWRRVLLGLLILFMALVAWLAITAPLSQSLQPIAPPSITLVTSEGAMIARRGAIIDAPVEIAKLPRHVPDAFLAIEDRRFYNHLGVDPIGIGRAMWRNISSGKLREGGSTITQQLAKVAFLNADRTAGRKLRELMISFWLEAWLTKDEILARYLSNVYFGDNVYGLRAASLHYFNRQPEKLNVSQAAMLAGLVKAPSRLAPTVNLKGAQARSKLVIAAMVEGGFIDQKIADGAMPATLNVRAIKAAPSGTYFADWVLPDARDRAGDLYAEQTVKTTLDKDFQRFAERAVRRGGLGKAQVALIAMRPDGRVVAMIGGRDYKNSSFNRATQARRQPGSTFKLFVYLAALRAGMTPNTMVDDSPITIGTWSPRNSNGKYRGKITLEQAFSQSSNVVAVRLADSVGRDAVIRAARDLGVTSSIGSEPSMALGTSGMTLLELTSAYAAVAGNSWPVKAHGLPEQQAGWFDAFWDRKRSFDKDTTWPMLLDLLSAAANQGTGRSAALRTRTFGKTGTTQDNRDAIFIGFAGDLVAGVWVGNDDNSPLNGVAGGGIPARIWRDFMMQAVENGVGPGIAPPAKTETPPEEDPLATINAAIGNVGIGVDIGQDGVSINLPSPEPRDEPRAPNERPAVTPPPVTPRNEGE